VIKNASARHVNVRKATFTTGEAAFVAGVSESTIKRWTNNGVLTSDRGSPRGARRIPRWHLIQVMRARKKSLARLEEGRIRVLIVTQDRTLVEVLEAAMPQELYFQSVIVPAHATAPSIAEQNTVDCAIVDFAKDGAYDCCQAIRHCQDGRTVCVIAIVPADANPTMVGHKLDAVFSQPVDAKCAGAICAKIRDLLSCEEPTR